MDEPNARFMNDGETSTVYLGKGSSAAEDDEKTLL